MNLYIRFNMTVNVILNAIRSKATIEVEVYLCSPKLLVIDLNRPKCLVCIKKTGVQLERSAASRSCS
jgi:hypothetical protein